MLEYEKPKFELQGVTFEPKPATPKNKDRIVELFEDEVEQLKDGDLTAEDQIEQMLKAFADPVDGDWDDIDFREVDQKEVEYYFQETFM